MESAKKSNIEFKSIVESLQDVIMRFDKQHRHLYVNKAAEELTGIKVDEFINKTHEELEFPSHLCELWGAAIDKVFTESISHRIEFELPNGMALDWLLVPEFNELNEVDSVLTTARDITKIHSAETELINNQKTFKDAFKLARLSTWEADIINNKTLLNPEFCNIIGIPFDSETPHMDSEIYFNDFVLEEDKERFVQKFKEASESKSEDYQDILNYRITRTDGSIIWIMATIRLRLDEEGNQIAAYGTFQDITSIKKTEEELAAHKLHLEELVEKRTVELKQSENKLKDAVNLAKLSTWQFDLKTEKLSISGILESKLEKERFEKNNTLKFERFIETIHPDDFKSFYSSIQKAMTTNDRNYYDILSYRMYGVDQVLRHVNITVKVRFNEAEDNPELLYGTIQDVTYLVESKIEKERLTSIIEATSDIVLITDVEGGILYVNEAGKQFIGFKSDYQHHKELVSKLFVDLNKDRIKTILTIVDKKKFWIGEGKIKRHDEAIIPVSVGIVAHRNHVNIIDCYSITLRDLSNQKKIENDLVYKNNELDTFVYRASHDLRGPIASLLGLYNIVKHEIQDSTALEFFDMYNNQIQRLNETILALIDLTRIKEQNAKSEAVDIESIVQGSISSFSHLPDFNEIKFDINISSVDDVITDKSLLTTIVQNLVENAIKYTRNDVDSIVEITILSAEDQLVIKVKDNGIGIEKKYHQKIFDMFFRGDTEAIGSGLGLYILKNAMEKLNGKITLDSEKGSGTTMTVQFPVGINESVF